MERKKSIAIFQKMCEVIPGGVNSPVRSCEQMHQLPMVIERAFADQLVDEDGHTYTDFCGSWGALIHGHAHPKILEAVKARMDKGTSFGITTAIEGKLAAEIVKLVDSVEQIRCVSSGTEATMSAVRLARGFTQRDLIVKFSGNYHGHTDYFLVQAGSGVLNTHSNSSSAGVPNEIVKHTINLPYNDIEGCRSVLFHPDFQTRIAAVILEPIAANMGVVPATNEFIKFLREATIEIGALLIFDEVITGFRVGLKGAQDYFSTQADLTCFGKIIGGGFPAAAFGGRREIMQCLAPVGNVYQAGTLSGNPLAMEAGLQSLMLLQEKKFYENLQAKTDLFLNPIKEKIAHHKWEMCIQEVGSMFTFFFGKKQVSNLQEALQVDENKFRQLFQNLFKQGVYIPPSPHEAWFISSAHHEENLRRISQLIIHELEKIN